MNYNKMLVKSPSSNCRVAVKILCGLALLWGLFFGVFIRNGAAALFKTEYLRPVTLQV